MDEEDDYDDTDYADTSSDSEDTYEPPEEPEEPEQLPSYDDRDYQQDEAAIPAGARPTGYSPQDDREYVTDPELLKELGTPPPPQQDAAAGDREYVTDPDLIKELGRPQKLPEAESATGTFVREAIHGAPVAAGAAAGAMYGAGLGTAFIPIPLLGTTVGGIVGGVIGGAAAGFATEAVVDKGQKLMGYDDDLIRTANKQANPISSVVGGAASNLAGFGPGLRNIASGAMGWGGRAVSGLFSGAGEAGMQAYHGTPVSEAVLPVLAQTVAGAIAPNPYSWGRAAEAAGARAGARIRPGEAYGPPEMQGPRQPPYVEPTQEPLPFGGDNIPYNPRVGAPQEAQIGGGERQLGLPFEPPAAPEVRSPQEIPFNRPTVDAEGQYGFNIEEPHGVGVPRTTLEDGQWVTQQASRSAMPDTGGVAKESAPPVGDRSTGDTRYGKDVPVTEGPASGINVLQPGQVDPTLRGGLQARTQTAEAPPAEAPTRYGGQFKQEPPRPVEPPPTAQPAVPEAAAPPKAAVAEPAGVKTAPPELEGKIAKAIGEPAPPAAAPPVAAPPAAPVPKSREAVWAVKGEERPIRISPIPAKKEGYTRITYKGKDQSVPNSQLREKGGASLAAAAEPIAGGKNLGPKEITFAKLPDGREPKIKTKSETTFNDALNKHGTWKGLLGELTPFIRRQVASTIGNMPVFVVPKSELRKYGRHNAIAYYNKQQNHIVINEAHLNNKQDMAHAVLHEGVHAVTSHAIDASPELKNMFRAIRLDARGGLSGKTIDPYLRNGFTSEHEFVAEAFSNKKFQDMLAAHELSPQVANLMQKYFNLRTPISTAWDAVVQAVRKILGVPASKLNALEATMRITEHAMSANEPAKAGMMAKHGVKTEDYAIHELPSGRAEVTTRDKFGNEAKFTGDTVHAAAAYAKGAGYKPHQIFEASGKVYEPPKGGAPKAAEAPAAEGKPAAAEPPKAAAEPERELVPATKSDLKTGLLASLRRNIGGMAMAGSESAQIAQAALRKAYGPLARLKEQTATRITNDIHRVANNMNKETFEKFVDAFESNKVSTLPKDQQALAEVLQKNYADFWNKIKELPGTEQMEATKDFLTHMYQNPEAVKKFASDFFGASGGSLRGRKYPTFADARAAGLTAFSNNPVEHFIRYSEGVSNYLGQRQMMLDIEGQNRLGYFGPKTVGASGTPEPLVRGAPPEGYAKIDVPWATKNGQSAYAPRDIAETINQHYSAGLRRSQTKDIYEFMQQTKNAWTAVELGLSMYHATTMGVESMASGVGRAMQLAGTGDFRGATSALVRAPAEPITSYLYGREGRKIYRDTTGTVGTPMQQKIVDVLTQANVQPGNLRITGEYDMSRLGNFWDARKRGSLMNEIQAQMKSVSDSYGLKLPGVLFDNVRRAMQTLSKPLFEHYIPELKLGTMMKHMEDWYKHNPNATDAQALKYARKVADSIDNRMGEMNYDNLFMNKTAKDLGMLTLRSFGFTVGGPIREIGAGAGRLALTAAKRENPLKHFDLRSEAADPRTAYAMAFLPTIAAISAVYQYMRTGKGPEDWRDLATPQTGGKIKSINKEVPERILVPGYHKDFLGYFVNNPLHEIGAKIAAPWTAIAEQLTGKDWRGQDYVPPRATTLEWLKEHAKQAGSHALPIGPKQLYEGTKKGSALTIPEQMLGVRTPGAYMLNPKGLEDYLAKKGQREWSGRERQTNRERQQRDLPPLPARRLPRAAE